MTCEYRVSFDTNEEAVEFQKFLKTLSISSKIEVELVDSYDQHYSGTVKAFTSFIADKRRTLSEVDEKLRGEVKEMLDSLEKETENKKKLVSDLYAEYPEGVSFSLNTIDLDNLGSLSEAEVLKAFSFNLQLEFTTKHYTLELLMRNGTVVFDGVTKKWTILKKMNVDEVVFDAIGIQLDLAEPVDLVYYDLTSTVVHYPSYSYTVIASPAIYLSDLTKVSDFFSEVGFSSDECEEEYGKLSNKRFGLVRVLNLILDGCSSVGELRRQLSEPGVVTRNNPRVFFRADVSIQYLNGVLADLKKLGLVSNKNGLLKVDSKRYVRSDNSVN